MKKIIENTIFAAILAIALLGLMALILRELEPEQWYAGQHDGQHYEDIDRDGKCHCYERLVAADRAATKK